MVKKTPLYEKHKNLGAKIIEFAGYWMPVQYSSITEEHLAVRNAAGLFDVSHMGEFIVAGENAEYFLNYITINDVAKLNVGQVQYNAMCYPDGGLVDDLLIYKFKLHYMMVVNASNIHKDFQHIQHYIRGDVRVNDESDKTALMALQGPKSRQILQKITKYELEKLEYYHVIEDTVADIKSVISRTGYTGELGYEIYTHPDDAESVWDAIMEVGEPLGLKPAGLGARDSLRLEMKFCLYGNDITKYTNPLEAGLGWITKLKKGDFLGRDALVHIKSEGIKRKLVGFVLEGKAFPRQHYSVIIDGFKVSEVTSGTFSPVLKKGIGLTYLPIDKCKIGQPIEVEIRNKRFKGKVTETPFIKHKS